MEIERFDGHFSLVKECGEERYIPEMYADGIGELIEARFGYGVRLSAPGYLDCTEWEVFDTEAEADAMAKELESE